MLAHEYILSLPQWLRGELANLPTRIEGDEAQMALVNRLADRNWREGNGGPFAAMVVDHITGELLSVGVNVVLSTRISSGHAEVTTLGSAQGTSVPNATLPWSSPGARVCSAKPNTVQLARCDVGAGRVSWLGPVGVMGSFDVPLDVLAFHDSGC